MKTPASVSQDINPAEIPKIEEEKVGEPKEPVAVIWTSVKEFIIPRKYKIIASILVSVPIAVIILAFLVKFVFIDLIADIKLSKYRYITLLPKTQKFEDTFNGRSLNKDKWVYEELTSDINIVEVVSGKLVIKIPKSTALGKQIIYKEKIEGYYTIVSDINCTLPENIEAGSEAGITLSRGAGASIEYVTVKCLKTDKFGTTIQLIFNQKGQISKVAERGFINTTDLKVTLKRAPKKLEVTLYDRNADFLLGVVEGDIVDALDTLLLYASNSTPDYPGIDVRFDNVLIK